jgi:hypothetical protein
LEEANQHASHTATTLLSSTQIQAASEEILNLKAENDNLKNELEVLTLTNQTLSLKLQKVSKSALPFITEEAIMGSSVFKSVLDQARLFAEDAARCDEFKQKLNERSV